MHILTSFEKANYIKSSYIIDQNPVGLEIACVSELLFIGQGRYSRIANSLIIYLDTIDSWISGPIAPIRRELTRLFRRDYSHRDTP
jgi:hypothetical protein